MSKTGFYKTCKRKIYQHYGISVLKLHCISIPKKIKKYIFFGFSSKKNISLRKILKSK